MLRLILFALSLAGTGFSSAVTPGTVQASSSNMLSDDPVNNLNLSCAAPLPATGYPTELLNVYRTNYTSLTAYCSVGCSCPDSTTTTPTCKMPSDFTRAPDSYAVVNSTAYAACRSTCLCAAEPKDTTPSSPAAGSGSDDDKCTKGRITKAMIQAEKSEVVDLGCWKGSGDLWTRVNREFNPAKAVTCTRCLNGYLDTECKLQPGPLPSASCVASASSPSGTIAASRRFRA